MRVSKVCVLCCCSAVLRAGVISTERIVVKTTELTDNTVPPTGGQPGTQKHGVCERNVHHNESDKLSAKCSRAGVGAMKLVLATSSTVSRLGIAHTETLENAAVVVVCENQQQQNSPCKQSSAIQSAGHDAHDRP